MARPQRCLLSNRLMIWSSDSARRRKIELHCRASHIHRERSWSSVANCGQSVSLLFARGSFWQDSHRAEASQDSYLSFACKTCPRGQVLAISERWTKFWLLSPSSFAKVSAGCNPPGVLRMSVRLGEILVKESLITQDQLQKALEFQRTNGGKLGSCLTKMGFITDDDITGVLSRQYGVPSINLKYYEIDPNVIKLIPQDTASRYQVVPLSRVGSVLTIAMTDPTNVFAMDDIKFMTGFNVEPVVASESAIGDAISRFYGSSSTNQEELSSLMKDLVDEDNELELAAEDSELDTATPEKAAEEAPIIKLVNLILTDSVKRGASDIHLEPYELEMRVRFRVDGQLQTVMTPPLRLKDAITSRMKIMAKLDIAEKRLPQDGRIMIKYKADGKKKELDFRVSTVPTLYGEKIVLRLLDKENLRLDMTKLGFESESLKKFERNILRPYGMVLV